MASYITSIISSVATWVVPSKIPVKPTKKMVKHNELALIESIESISNLISFLYPSESNTSGASHLSKALNRVIRHIKNVPQDQNSIRAISKSITWLQKSIGIEGEPSAKQVDAHLTTLASKVTEAVSILEEQLKSEVLHDFVFIERSDLGQLQGIFCDGRFKNGEFYFLPLRKTWMIDPPSLIDALEGYPSQTRSIEEYHKCLHGFRGDVENLPDTVVSDLLHSPALNIPGDIEIERENSNPIIIRSQSATDLLRLDRLTINGKIICDDTILKKLGNLSEPARIAAIYLDCLHALDNDAKLVENIVKLFTQAVMARITLRLSQKLTNLNLGVFVSAPKLLYVDIFTKHGDGKQIKITYTAIFNIKLIAQNQIIKQISGTREIIVSKANLKSGSAEMAFVQDSCFPLNIPAKKPLLKEAFAVIPKALTALSKSNS